MNSSNIDERPRRQDDRSGRRNPDIVCFTCQKKGHIATKCPSKKAGRIQKAYAPRAPRDTGRAAVVESISNAIEETAALTDVIKDIATEKLDLIDELEDLKIRLAEASPPADVVVHDAESEPPSGKVPVQIPNIQYYFPDSGAKWYSPRFIIVAYLIAAILMNVNISRVWFTESCSWEYTTFDELFNGGPIASYVCRTLFNPAIDFVWYRPSTSYLLFVPGYELELMTLHEALTYPDNVLVYKHYLWLCLRVYLLPMLSVSLSPLVHI
jgi:hypothetical protein